MLPVLQLTTNCSPIAPLIALSNNTSTEPNNYLLFKFHFWVSLTVPPASVLLNGFSYHIFSQPIWKKSPMSSILLGLSMFEILFHINVFLHALLQTTIEPTNYTGALIKSVLAATNSLLQLTFQIARNWAVVMLAAYRYELICRPLAPKLFESKRITPLFIGAAFMAFLISLPRALDMAFLYCQDDWQFITEKSYFRTSLWYRYAYLWVIMFLVQSGGPVMIVCILSFLVIRVIWKRQKFRQAQNLQERSSSTNKLVLAICLAFFIFETPAFFSKVLQYPLMQQGLDEIDISLATIANILIYCDSLLNVVIYMSSNPTFRQASAKQLESFGIKINLAPLPSGEITVASPKANKGLLTTAENNSGNDESHV